MTEASVSFAGNLTDDPELRHTEGGIARAMFRVAVSGRRDQEPSFFTVIVWRDQAEHAAESLTKGSRIVVLSTTPASTPSAPSATTSASWRLSATRSPSNPPPDRPSPDNRHQADRIRAPPGYCRVPAHRGFSDHDAVPGSSPSRPLGRPTSQLDAFKYL
jgi:hypothetical protein